MRGEGMVGSGFMLFLRMRADGTIGSLVIHPRFCESLPVLFPSSAIHHAPCPSRRNRHTRFPHTSKRYGDLRFALPLS